MHLPLQLVDPGRGVPADRRPGATLQPQTVRQPLQLSLRCSLLLLQPLVVLQELILVSARKQRSEAACFTVPLAQSYVVISRLACQQSVHGGSLLVRRAGSMIAVAAAVQGYP